MKKRIGRIGGFLLAAWLAGFAGCTYVPDNVQTEESLWASTVSTTQSLPPETTQLQPAMQQPSAPTVDPAALEQEVQVLPQSGGAVSGRISVEAPGILVKSGGGAEIDYSNTSQGYVMVRFAEPCQQRLKVQVKGPTTTYTYNLTPEKWTAFPLSDQNGAYQVVVYRNVVDTRYAMVLSLSLEVSLEDEFAPFLHSNQYVNFDAAPNTVARAAVLTGGISEPLGKVQAVYDYVVGNISYDYDLASSVTTGYLPDLDAVLEKMRGICFDYASLMTGMLRSQGIPAKLVVGYAGDTYHAWISVWSEETGWVDGAIYFDGLAWKRMDPTFASTGGADMLEFIGNADNYSAKYFY